MSANLVAYMTWDTYEASVPAVLDEIRCLRVDLDVFEKLGLAFDLAAESCQSFGLEGVFFLRMLDVVSL